MQDEWRTIPKTQQMLQIEEEFGSIDIREVILSELRKVELDQEAAKMIGITPSVLSRWIRVLSIYDEAHVVWEDRKTERAVS